MESRALKATKPIIASERLRRYGLATVTLFVSLAGAWLFQASRFDIVLLPLFTAAFVALCFVSGRQWDTPRVALCCAFAFVSWIVLPAAWIASAIVATLVDPSTGPKSGLMWMFRGSGMALGLATIPLILAGAMIASLRQRCSAAKLIAFALCGALAGTVLIAYEDMRAERWYLAVFIAIALLALAFVLVNSSQSKLLSIGRVTH